MTQNIVRLSPSGPPRTYIGPIASAIGYTNTDSLELTVIGAPHAPGLYQLLFVSYNRPPVAASSSVIYSWDQLGGGPFSINAGSIPYSSQVTNISLRTIASAGTAPFTITVTPISGIGTTTCDFYACLMWCGQPL